jgi:hypothetical protein
MHGGQMMHEIKIMDSVHDFDEEVNEAIVIANNHSIIIFL